MKAHVRVFKATKAATSSSSNQAIEAETVVQDSKGSPPMLPLHTFQQKSTVSSKFLRVVGGDHHNHLVHSIAPGLADHASPTPRDIPGTRKRVLFPRDLFASAPYTRAASCAATPPLQHGNFLRAGAGVKDAAAYAAPPSIVPPAASSSQATNASPPLLPSFCGIARGCLVEWRWRSRPEWLVRSCDVFAAAPIGKLDTLAADGTDKLIWVEEGELTRILGEESAAHHVCAAVHVVISSLMQSCTSAAASTAPTCLHTCL